MSGSSIDRRAFVQRTLLTTASGWAVSVLGDALGGKALANEAVSAAELKIATFRIDATPPLGHSCCGGWIKPIEAVDDEQEAIGVVLLGAGKPIVLMAVDWTGVLNEAHLRWRIALAEAADTSPERVAIHCVHQHNAPFACIEAEKLVAEQGDLPHILDLKFFDNCLTRSAEAVRKAITIARPVTHIGHGQGKVDQVASNRRVHRDEKGTVIAMRGSACADEKLRALPEGTIDPWLKTVAFFDGEKKIAALHYYAVHPMSYYGDGRASSDFAGLARKKRQADEPDCLHVYFTGCSGNIAAGKYNDGAKPTRAILTQRMYDGLVASEKELKKSPVTTLAWRTAEMLPPPRSSLNAEALAKLVASKDQPVVNRNRPALQWAWLHRVERKQPIILSALHLGDVKLLHLPAESFIEYQLRAQSLVPDGFVCTAAYGDGGPWYIPTKEEYPAGGYEVSVAFCEPDVDDAMTAGMRHILG